MSAAESGNPRELLIFLDQSIGLARDFIGGDFDLKFAFCAVCDFGWRHGLPFAEIEFKERVELASNRENRRKPFVASRPPKNVVGCWLSVVGKTGRKSFVASRPLKNVVGCWLSVVGCRQIIVSNFLANC